MRTYCGCGCVHASCGRATSPQLQFHWNYITTAVSIPVAVNVLLRAGPRARFSTNPNPNSNRNQALALDSRLAASLGELRPRVRQVSLPDSLPTSLRLLRRALPSMFCDVCALATREYDGWCAERGAKRRFRTPVCHKLHFDAVALAESQREASGVKVRACSVLCGSKAWRVWKVPSADVCGPAGDGGWCVSRGGVGGGCSNGWQLHCPLHTPAPFMRASAPLSYTRSYDDQDDAHTALTLRLTGGVDGCGGGGARATETTRDGTGRGGAGGECEPRAGV